MKIRNEEVIIDIDEPFKNCKLKREKYADVLTSLVENYKDGFVLAINNKWGAGKTTFVKMWEQKIKNKNYNTIYFNAWENDFEDNPLTALIGELNIINKSDKTFNKVVESASKLAKNILPAITKGILNKYIDSQLIIDVIAESTKTATEIFEADVNEYAKRKESIKDFRKNLGEFVANNFNGQPLIFIIDELDRCRPNYSVSLLEQVKHFFNVPNIIFVLSIDKEQLRHAICGVYGSEKIDTEQYLKRFIDIEYTIPQPETENYFEYLYDYYDFDSFLNSKKRQDYSLFNNDIEKFKKILKGLIGNLTLREQEKIMSYTRVIFKTLECNNHIVPIFFSFLVYCKFKETEYYYKLLNFEASIEDAQEMMYNILNKPIFLDVFKFGISIEAQLLLSYSLYLKANHIEYLTILNFDNMSREYSLNYKSKFNDGDLLNYLVSIQNDYYNNYLNELSLNYFFDILELSSRTLKSS
ncbi:hypothetical protein EB1_04190 [Empedobacter brevis NBRC 14943 = ATCC 43319]|uniref:KAP NTPase domain-containing protein n=1 Tax=Empedobacter brevis NBRC 14943 = ATCC 43319 TaxID=1218108 RepID=A0A511NCT2_9FLAO|nr:P-loop NTPase fold protein [Empedobacter brevis]GEM50629.1 hypothetical protein EB1_04190 [Empedobacter brevis NBRC 14943 = ATCC 43319]